MKVILREDVENLGKMGSLLDVSDGYARNFLIPRKKAILATDQNTRALEHEKKIIEGKLKKIVKEAEEFRTKIEDLTLHIMAQAGEEGKIFGSVTSADIAEALAKESFQVDKKKIHLEKPIKELGLFTVPVKIHSDVIASVKVSVEAATA